MVFVSTVGSMNDLCSYMCMIVKGYHQYVRSKSLCRAVEVVKNVGDFMRKYKMSTLNRKNINNANILPLLYIKVIIIWSFRKP